MTMLLPKLFNITPVKALVTKHTKKRMTYSIDLRPTSEVGQRRSTGQVVNTPSLGCFLVWPHPRHGFENTSLARGLGQRVEVSTWFRSKNHFDL
jgi:hypothetical protein